MDNNNRRNSSSSDPLDSIDNGGFKNTNRKQIEAEREWHEKLKEGDRSGDNN